MYLLILFLMLFILFFLSESLIKSDFFYKISIILSWLILTLFMGNRNIQIGTDTYLYEQMFVMNYGPFSDKTNAYFYLRKIHLYMNLDYRVLLFILAGLVNLIFLYFFYRTNKKNVSKYVYMYIVLAYFIQSMNITRQMIGIGLVMIGLSYLVEGKKISFILFIILATLFHPTALIGLFFLVIWEFRKNDKIYILSLFPIMIISLFFMQIFTIVVRYLPKYVIYLDPYRNDYIGNTGFGLRLLLTSILYLLFVVLYKYLVNKLNINNHLMDFYCLLIYLGSISGILFKQIPNFDRITLYFTTPVLIFIPYVISLFVYYFRKIKPINVYLGFLIYLVLIIIFYLYYINNWGGIFPFEFRDFF